MFKEKKLRIFLTIFGIFVFFLFVLIISKPFIERKIKNQQNDYVFSMKKKCLDIVTKSYNENKPDLKLYSYDLMRYGYNSKLNTCVYESREWNNIANNPLSLYYVSVRDALSGQKLIDYTRIGDENPPMDDYNKKADELFEQ